MAAIDIPTSLENLKLERDAILLYEALARIDQDAHRRAAFERIASNERRHADIWAAKLTELGAVVPPVPSRPRARVRVIIGLARLFGTRSVAELVKALEGDEEDVYAAQGAGPEVAAIAADEREHARIWDELGNGSTASTGNGAGSASASTASQGATATAGAGERIAAARRAGSAAEVGRREGWHRASGRSGTLRAVIFGVSDGLVSNLSLVMGVAGAAASEPRFILLAGIAGLLAGACSMAAGEYISMQSQRELFERQIALERAEMEAIPEEEQAELAAAYRAKGFEPAEADRIAERIFQDPEMALDTLVREELGLDPDELGSPIGAAVGSFVAFALGAVVPVVPFLLGGGAVVVAVSLGLSLVALFAVGAGVSLLTGRGLLFSGGRQMLLGLGAAVVTYGIGTVIGVSTAG